MSVSPFSFHQDHFSPRKYFKLVSSGFFFFFLSAFLIQWVHLQVVKTRVHLVGPEYSYLEPKWIIKNSPYYLFSGNQEFSVVLFMGRSRNLKWDKMLYKSKIVPGLSFWIPLHISTSCSCYLSRTFVLVANNNLGSTIQYYYTCTIQNIKISIS